MPFLSLASPNGPTAVDLTTDQGDEHVRGPADEYDINRSTDVGGECLRWQPRGICGHTTTTAVDAQHAAGASVRDVQRPVRADRASGDEGAIPKAGELSHHRTSTVVRARCRRNHRGQQADSSDEQTRSDARQTWASPSRLHTNGPAVRWPNLTAPATTPGVILNQHPRPVKRTLCASSHLCDCPYGTMFEPLSGQPLAREAAHG